MSKVEQYLETVPPRYQELVRRAMNGRGPRARANAIHAFCLTCCHWDVDEVRNCPTWRCPLHAFRPFAKHTPAVSKTQEDWPSEGEIAEMDDPARGASTGPAADAHGAFLRADG